MERLKIRVSGLRYAVGGTEILKGVDVQIPDGAITAVVGPSGAGNSTLLGAGERARRLIAGKL